MRVSINIVLSIGSESEGARKKASKARATERRRIPEDFVRPGLKGGEYIKSVTETPPASLRPPPVSSITRRGFTPTAPG